MVHRSSRLRIVALIGKRWRVNRSAQNDWRSGRIPNVRFADPDTGIGIAYAMNRLGFDVWSESDEYPHSQSVYL
jgi:hypothetical protein